MANSFRVPFPRVSGELERVDPTLKRAGEQFDRNFDELARLVESAAASSTVNAPHLLVMSATGVSVASGGAYTPFGKILAQHQFGTVSAPGTSWAHPVSGVYVLTYEHAWGSYTGGGTIELEIDGVTAAANQIAAGGSGANGRGSLAYFAVKGAVGKIKVTQSSGSAQTCDAVLRVAIPDPSSSDITISPIGNNVVSFGTQAAPNEATWTAGGSPPWNDPAAHWIWHTAPTSRPAGEQAWFQAGYSSETERAVTIEVAVDNNAEVWLNGTKIVSAADAPAYNTRVAKTVTVQAGLNQITAWAQNTGSGSNPAGFILSMADARTGDVLLRTTDAGGWTAATSEPVGWPTP